MTTSTHDRPRWGLGALWLPLLLGPFLWGLTEVVLYPVSAQACYTGFIPAPVPPAATGARWFGGVWVIVAIVLTMLTLLLAIRRWRGIRAGGGGGGASAASDASDAVAIRVRFMSLAGLIVSGVFVYAILMYGLGVAFTGMPCG